MLQIGSVQSQCEEFILKSLKLSNCLEVMISAAACGSKVVSDAATTIALWWFDEIIHKKEFEDLPFECLMKYLDDTSLNTGQDSEWNVWVAAEIWIEVDKSSRVDHILSLLKVLRYQSLTVSDISNLLFYPVIDSSSEASNFLSTMLNLKKESIPLGNDEKYKQKIKELLENDREPESIPMNDMCLRLLHKSRRNPCLLPCFVGFKEFESKNDEIDVKYNNVGTQNPVFYMYHPSRNFLEEVVTLKTVCEGPITCSGFQVCTIGPSIYVVGGEFLLGYSNWNMDVWSYNTATCMWAARTRLKTPRRHYMVATLGHVIYLIGGCGRHRIMLSSVECYDTESDIWTTCTDLPATAYNAAICTHKETILVFFNLMVFIYYPAQDFWSSECLPGGARQGYHSAHSCDGVVILTGKFSKDIYLYDVDNKIVTSIGCFKTDAGNVCMIANNLFNFSRDDDEDKNTIEVLQNVSENVHDGGFKPIENSIVDDKGSTINKPVRSSDLLWGEKIKKRSFLPAGSNQSFSFGATPLFKP